MCFRFPDEKAGEVPIAQIVRSPDSTLTEHDVKRFVENRVCLRYYIITYFVYSYKFLCCFSGCTVQKIARSDIRELCSKVSVGEDFETKGR